MDKLKLYEYNKHKYDRGCLFTVDVIKNRCNAYSFIFLLKYILVIYYNQVMKIHYKYFI